MPAIGVVKGLVAAGISVKVPVSAGADCRVKPVKSKPAIFVGQVRMTLVPEEVMVSCGANARLKTVPFAEVPPELVVPYKLYPDKTNPPNGVAPSLLV